MISKAKRSEITKAAWRKRKREGGKGLCFHCKENIYVGGARRNGHLYHEICWEIVKASGR